MTGTRDGMRLEGILRVQLPDHRQTRRSDRHDEQDQHQRGADQRPVTVRRGQHGSDDDDQADDRASQPDPASRRVLGDQPPRTGAADRHTDDHGHERGKVAHREDDENHRQARVRSRSTTRRGLADHLRRPNPAPCSCPPCPTTRDPCRHPTARHARRHHTEEVIDAPTGHPAFVPAQVQRRYVGARSSGEAGESRVEPGRAWHSRSSRRDLEVDQVEFVVIVGWRRLGDADRCKTRARRARPGPGGTVRVRRRCSTPRCGAARRRSSRPCARAAHRGARRRWRPSPARTAPRRQAPRTPMRTA